MSSYGKIVKLTGQQLSELQEVVVEDVLLLNQWDATDKETTSQKVVEMSQWLSPRPEVIEFDKNSSGDQIAKFDLAFKFPAVEDEEGILNEGKIIAFQVKSSEYYALEHLAKNSGGSTYKGSKYPCPGVFVTSEISWAALCELARFVGAVVDPAIEAVVFKALKFKSFTQPGGVGPWLPQRQYIKLLPEPELLQKLGVIALAGGRITFLI